MYTARRERPFSLARKTTMTNGINGWEQMGKLVMASLERHEASFERQEQQMNEFRKEMQEGFESIKNRIHQAPCQIAVQNRERIDTASHHRKSLEDMIEHLADDTVRRDDELKRGQRWIIGTCIGIIMCLLGLLVTAWFGV